MCGEGQVGGRRGGEGRAGSCGLVARHTTQHSGGAGGMWEDIGGGGGWMTGENQNNCVSRASNSSTGTLQKSACFHAG